MAILPHSSGFIRQIINPHWNSHGPADAQRMQEEGYGAREARVRRTCKAANPSLSASLRSPQQRHEGCRVEARVQRAETGAYADQRLRLGKPA